MILVFILTGVIAFYLVQYQRRRRRLVKLANKFQGPPTLPLIGNLHQFIGPADKILKTLKDWSITYKNGYRLWILNELYIVVSNPEDVQILSSKMLEKGDSYRFLHDLIGDGLITCSFAKWRRKRRIIERAFNTIVWSNYFIEVFNQQNRRLVGLLNNQVGTKKHFDAWPYLISASFKTICENAMGYREEGDKVDHIVDSQEAHIKAARLSCKRTYQPWLQPAIVFKIYTYVTGYDKIFKHAQDLPREMIKEKRQLLNKRRGSMDNNAGPNGISSTNLLEVLMEAQKEKDILTDEELVDEMLTIMTAGAETNALINGFTLLMLAMHPNIQEKVYEEQRELFQNSNRLPNIEDLNKMNFLEQCLKESLRLFTTVPAMYRRVDEDIHLSNNKVIPAGCSLVVSSIAIHYNENIYPEPEKWNPQNFDAEVVRGRHPCAFIPFGFGPRICLGYKYAYLSMKAQLSPIIRNYKITTDLKMEDVELDYDFLLRSKHGYQVKLDYRGDSSIF